jgi:hypothetical protein
MHLDGIAAAFPSARVTGLSIAGFYLPSYAYSGPKRLPPDSPSALADFSPEGWRHLYGLYNSSVSLACAAAMQAEPWLCMLAHYSWPFVSTPVFVVQPLTDSIVLGSHCAVPVQLLSEVPQVASYVAAWQTNMSQALAGIAAAGRVFAPKCMMHSAFSSERPQVSGATFLVAFREWYSGNGGNQSWVDSCSGVACNPSCSSSSSSSSGSTKAPTSGTSGLQKRWQKPAPSRWQHRTEVPKKTRAGAQAIKAPAPGGKKVEHK